MKRKILIFALVLFSLYLISYIWLRQTRAETREQDGKVYVIFPEDKVLYYIVRPASYIDGKITGIDFHIGQHG
jgi:hypothetical protein